ncbi:uncharacterized protein LOC120922368 [Rana temporaria]|uniref:uncharacterized protein LOC120922368 n=1 Tax=Rana temporaria TaxID=8407 RepID=UPI001AAD4B3D|nr:uncharacterized protein LOC120922368 [Rana temporaria]
MPSSYYTDLPDEIQDNWDPDSHVFNPEVSPPHSLSSKSPAKTRMKYDHSEQSPVIPATSSSQDQVGLKVASSIACYPTSGKPVLDTTMKDMLLSLQSSLMVNISAMLNNFSIEMKGLGERVLHVENKIEKQSKTVNNLVNAYRDQMDDADWMRAKIADLEDRSRRENIKLRGVPESIAQADLQKYAGDMIMVLLPDISPIERMIDRIHRIPKPKHLDASVPRDVLMKINFFPTKEKLLTRARSQPELPAPYKEVHMYADLSKYTLNMRRQLKTVTKALNNHKIPYKWRHPATLLITSNGKTIIISKPLDGLRLLHSWGILPKLSDEERRAMDGIHLGKGSNTAHHIPAAK